MSGHSKWATIKRAKAATDAKRGKLFTKVTKEIIQAAKIGGGNPDMNPRLRSAVLSARAVNMPQDNIKKAIMKGTGELQADAMEDLVYEGYGPGGIAVMVEVTTDNKNRTASEIRSIFTKRGGNLGEPGSVSWMFEKKGKIEVGATAINEEELLALSIDAGAEDMSNDGERFLVLTQPADFDHVYEAIKKRVEPLTAEISMVPKNSMNLEDKKTAEQVLKLLDALDDMDDVQHVYSNMDISDDLMNQIQNEGQ
jgi:YebC/PmpR family DNA-binding regulatory protein